MKLRRVPRSRSGRAVAAALALAALAGCAPPGPPKPDEAKISQFAAHGYVSGENFTVASFSPTWTLGSDSYPVTLTVPEKAGPFPLVIYLPALGESRNAGSKWRLAWTRAGYAVLSIQPLADDEAAWSSPRARTGDFAGIARQRYGAAAMSARIGALQAVWRDLLQRQARAEAPLERVDVSRVAIAGYDLGAYTAMAIAGEELKNFARPAIAIPVRAVIALSPYADFSGLSFAERYRGIAGPVLSVTSDIDTDPVGVVTAPSVRKAPFEYMPAKDKFLVLMWGVPHFVLAGNEGNTETREGYGPGDRPAQSRESQRQGDGSAGRRRGGAASGGPVQPASDPQDRSFGIADSMTSVTSNAIGGAAIAGVTTAYLDTYLKNDAIAREWLAKDAARWLRERGEFKSR